MKTLTNLDWIKTTNVTENDLKCSCGGTLKIYHCSNHHNGTGRYYTTCNTCQKDVNVSWKSKPILT